MLNRHAELAAGFDAHVAVVDLGYRKFISETIIQ
jgi:hypothetical protein